jgi:hypothetical protein
MTKSRLPSVDVLMADVITEYQLKELEARLLIREMLQAINTLSEPYLPFIHPTMNYQAWVQRAEQWLQPRNFEKGDLIRKAPPIGPS